MKELPTLGENLKRARENKCYTQEYVSRQLNISRQAISKWETGKGYPDLDNLVLLSNLYDASLDELTNNKNLQKKSNKNLDNLTNSNDLVYLHIEEILLAVILSISCLYLPIGLLIPIGVLIWMKKKKRFYITIIIFSIYCILLYFYNLFSIFNIFIFDIGENLIGNIL